MTELIAQGHNIGVMENFNIYWQARSAEKWASNKVGMT